MGGYQQAVDLGFEPLSPDFFGADELRHVKEIIALGSYTCSECAVRAFRGMHTLDGFGFNGVAVSSFRQGVEELIRRQTRGAALLVPDLHAGQKMLERKKHYVELTTQRFRLPNLPLYVAKPEHAGGCDRLLWVLPTLMPLVEQAYGGDVPFDHYTPCQSTFDAANSCSIWGEGRAVTSQLCVRAFRMTPEVQLPHRDVTWRLYMRRPKWLAELLENSGDD